MGIIKMKATIIGLGLIGGSLSKELRRRGIVEHIIGVDANPVNAKEALGLNLADEIRPLEQSLDSDIILLSIPVDKICSELPGILNNLKPAASGLMPVIIDMGSTKKNICASVHGHKQRGRFVAAHPIAGTENFGPSAAINNLFDEKIAIICEREFSDPDALEMAERLFKVVGMKLLYMTSEEHDMHLAYVSHLSHITSFALGNTVLDIEKDHKNIFNLAGSGFASTVRLAKSSPHMWEPIMEQNSENILTALDAYIEKLKKFRQMINNKDEDKLFGFMENANQIRKVLDKI